MDEFSRIVTIAHLRSVRTQIEASIELEEKAIQLACLTGEQPDSIINRAKQVALAGGRADDIIDGWINDVMKISTSGVKHVSGLTDNND